MITVEIPGQLSSLAGGQEKIQLRASTLSELLQKLGEKWPILRSQLLDAKGEIRQFVGIFVDGRQVADIGDASIHLGDGSKVLVTIAVAGG